MMNSDTLLRSDSTQQLDIKQLDTKQPLRHNLLEARIDLEVKDLDQLLEVRQVDLQM